MVLTVDPTVAVRSMANIMIASASSSMVTSLTRVQGIAQPLAFDTTQQKSLMIVVDG